MKRHLSFHSLSLPITPLHSLILAALLFASCGNNNSSVAVHVDTAQAPATEIHSIKDSLSWAYGQYLALALQGEYFDTVFDHDLVLEAFAYTLKGGTQNPLTDEMARDIAQYANMQYAAIMQHKAKNMAETVDSLQRVYFANLKKTNPAIKQKQVGDYLFYYEVLKAGHGPKAEFAQRIRFDYKSFNLLSGQPIDQTYGNREPIIHVVGSPMFPGLIEAFQLMNVGSIYRFYFPYQLAFGAEGTEGLIPPFTPVIYEIELHELYEY
jgi:FKBP-type peptidyl-prolyl cis-trans isomerase